MCNISYPFKPNDSRRQCGDWESPKALAQNDSMTAEKGRSSESLAPLITETHVLGYLDLATGKDEVACGQRHDTTHHWFSACAHRRYWSNSKVSRIIVATCKGLRRRDGGGPTLGRNACKNPSESFCYHTTQKMPSGSNYLKVTRGALRCLEVRLRYTQIVNRYDRKSIRDSSTRASPRETGNPGQILDDCTCPFG